MYSMMRPQREMKPFARQTPHHRPLLCPHTLPTLDARTSQNARPSPCLTVCLSLCVCVCLSVCLSLSAKVAPKLRQRFDAVARVFVVPSDEVFVSFASSHLGDLRPVPVRMYVRERESE